MTIRVTVACAERRDGVRFDVVAKPLAAGASALSWAQGADAPAPAWCAAGRPPRAGRSPEPLEAAGAVLGNWLVHPRGNQGRGQAQGVWEHLLRVGVSHR